ncbi:fumarylacetoacetate hydrolase family protein [Paenibacillus sp. FJAT-26967]|uniref:fumarylacetoacetate hydrolase family protein n=1 Tax=Paenibacillus sp. FJAT-26967 TaxID=1729690 RepID=UPI00083974F2|nr:fumarylacetoacetate hydrolase family protein [Paenibacillus sp. FJAT-26967]
MKFVTFMGEEGPRLGIKLKQGVLDVAEAVKNLPDCDDGSVPTHTHALIEGGEEAVEALQKLVDALPESSANEPYLLEESSLMFCSSVPNPDKIICVGLNYQKHAEETKAAVPEHPILFNKFKNALTGHNCDVPLPEVAKEIDYEAELAIVIGKKAKDVRKEEVSSYIFGYTCANDLSARDLQRRTNQWMIGKSCDGFAPLGPYLVTPGEVGDPNRLKIRSLVNGEVRQDSNTSDMIFNVEELVSYISHHMTLMPGDVILTGTPEGVIVGYPRESRVYLKDGDQVTVEIEQLGSLTNKLVTEKKLQDGKPVGHTLGV